MKDINTQIVELLNGKEIPNKGVSIAVTSGVHEKITAATAALLQQHKIDIVIVGAGDLSRMESKSRSARMSHLMSMLESPRFDESMFEIKRRERDLYIPPNKTTSKKHNKGFNNRTKFF